MRLDGIHHITATTGDAATNVDFYVRVLGLRLVKKTVNQDDPSVYHLFFADDAGSPGADLTFFEYPGARQGVAGDGMVCTVAWRVASPEAVDFWEQRLSSEGVICTPTETGGLAFRDPEGLSLELVVEPDVRDAPLRATASDIPAEHAFLGFAGVRVFASEPAASAAVFSDVLGFEQLSPTMWKCSGPSRSSWIAHEPPPAGVRGVQGAGVVHHVAFSSELDEQADWHLQTVRAGLRPSPVIDRFYFQSVYFFEPGGVLFEIATKGPGFTMDEDPQSLGRRLSLPPRFEPLRDEIERILTPLPELP